VAAAGTRFSGVINPVEVEQQMLDVAAHIERGVHVVRDAELACATAKREFDRAWALAFGKATGAVKSREVEAMLVTMPQREAFEIAEVAYHHAQRLSRALEKKLDALRSVGASVRTAYAGTN
jgi:hypothetical protein